MTGTVRRVVTGHRAGRAVIVSDEVLTEAPLPDGGGGRLGIWGRDDVARYPDDGAQPVVRPGFPPVGGCRFAHTWIDPGDSARFDRYVIGSLTAYADADNPGFHRTPSLDFVIVSTGTVRLELDGGDQAELTAGDVVIQNGTNHRWVNVGDDRVLLVSVVIGADQ